MDISLVWLVNLYYITDRVYIMVDWNDANAKKFLLFLYCDVKKEEWSLFNILLNKGK